MEATDRTLEQHRSVLAEARAALATFSDVLYQANGADLGELLGELDGLYAAAGGVMAQVVFETERRGEMAEAGMNTREWVYEYAPSMRQGGFKALSAVVHTVAVSARPDFTGSDVPLFKDGHPLSLIWDKVGTGECAPPLALAIWSEIKKLTPRLAAEGVPVATEALLEVGIASGPAKMRDLKIEILADHARDGDQVEEEQQRLAPHAFLSCPQVESGDLTRYSMALTPEQSAALEAAIGPLSAPAPNPETGERDLRSNGQRRAEALTDICGIASAVAAEGAGGPAASDACIQVVVELAELHEDKGAGEVLGSRAAGTLLGIETMRKISCDADLIAVVLGEDGEVLNEGRVKRLFTRRQRRSIHRRDQTCTYPGCNAPASWTRIHHVHHWSDGGATDIGNAALLCQRHHTHVHNKRLWAEVRSTPDAQGRYVIWDTTTGSYDHALAYRLKRHGPDPWAGAA
ncbi:MAG: DUF222 domain-containing protein [Actinomycetia bacterium]|nr:DUF222 domain-containing protein [Actinomycetes bacterium]